MAAAAAAAAKKMVDDTKAATAKAIEALPKEAKVKVQDSSIIQGVSFSRGERGEGEEPSYVGVTGYPKGPTSY